MAIANPIEGEHGFWNSIRETIICSMVDTDNNHFEIRLLVDPGATISTIPLFTLCRARGKWDVKPIRKIQISGINSMNECDLVCHARIEPGQHLSAEFKEAVKLPKNFSLEVDFFLMRGMQVFTSFKPAMPTEIVSTLSGKTYHLADPEQIAIHDSVIYIHGILGVNAISQLGKKSFQAVPGTKLTTCRSYFGDLLFGASHFLYNSAEPNKLPLDDSAARVTASAATISRSGRLTNDLVMCSAMMASLGLSEYNTEATETASVEEDTQGCDPSIFEYCLDDV